MATISAIAETTSNNFSGGAFPDADDPAIYYNQSNPGASIVIGTHKNAGLSVYDLQGNEIQRINPGNIRYNNVDIVNDFNLGSQQVDLAIASERNNDSLSIFQIDPDSQTLGDITSAELSSASASIFGADNGNDGAYGLAAYQSIVDGKSYVFVTQNDGNEVAQLELADDGTGKVTASVVRTLTLPSGGGKAEGLVIDRRNGTLYVSQENFGIYKFDAEVNGGNSFSVVDSISNGSGELEGDIEGLTIDYSSNHLVASSQGNNTFVRYDLQGDNRLVDTFNIGSGNGIDGVQATDGVDILNHNLGGDFAQGILVVQDGQNNGNTTNFKYVSLEDLPNEDEPTSPENPDNPLQPIQPIFAENPSLNPVLAPLNPGQELAETTQISFQSGNSYNGTVDTFVREASPNSNNSNSSFLDVDGSDDILEVQSLLRFDNIFGDNQIPEDAQITSARLELNAFDKGDSLQFHRMVTDWDNTDTWNSLDNGIQADGTDAVANPDALTGAVSTGLLSVDVTASVRSWQENPESNYGWAILPTGSDGVDLYSSEGSISPNLIVEYTLDDSDDAVITALDSDI